MRLTPSRGGILALALGLAQAGYADEGKPKPKPAPAAEPAEAEPEPEAKGQEAAHSAREPGYRGVAPERGKVDPPHAPRKKNPLRVTWTGFQMRPDGGSRVFVQLTADAAYQVADSPGGISVTIKGARLHLRNNARPLDTHFFASPVKSVHAKERSGQVTISIDTRGKATHTERVEPRGGYQFLLIDFGSNTPADSAVTSTTTQE